MRGFLLWAPDRPHGHPPPKSVSNPVSSQDLLTFSPLYGRRGLAKNRGFGAVLIEPVPHRHGVPMTCWMSRRDRTFVHSSQRFRSLLTVAPHVSSKMFVIWPRK